MVAVKPSASGMFVVFVDGSRVVGFPFFLVGSAIQCRYLLLLLLNIISKTGPERFVKQLNCVPHALLSSRTTQTNHNNNHDNGC